MKRKTTRLEHVCWTSIFSTFLFSSCSTRDGLHLSTAQDYLQKRESVECDPKEAKKAQNQRFYGKYDYALLNDEKIINFACVVSWELRKRAGKSGLISSYFGATEDAETYLSQNSGILGFDVTTRDWISTGSTGLLGLQKTFVPKEHKKMYEDAANQIEDALDLYHTRDHFPYDHIDELDSVYTVNGQALYLTVISKIRGISEIKQGRYPKVTADEKEKMKFHELESLDGQVWIYKIDANNKAIRFDASDES